MLPQKPNPTKQPIAHKAATWVMWAERVMATLGHTTLPFAQTHKFHWFALICDLKQLSPQFQGSVCKMLSYPGFTLLVKTSGLCSKMDEKQFHSTAGRSFHPAVWLLLLTSSCFRVAYNQCLFFFCLLLLLVEMEGWVNSKLLIMETQRETCSRIAS